MGVWWGSPVVATCRATPPRRAASCPPGTPGWRRRRWRCGSSCRPGRRCCTAAAESPPPMMVVALGQRGQHAGHRLGALGKLGELEHAHRPVPDDGAGAVQPLAETAPGCAGRCPGCASRAARRPRPRPVKRRRRRSGRRRRRPPAGPAWRQPAPAESRAVSRLSSSTSESATS